MARARRKKQKSSTGFGVFLLGVLVGAVPTALWFGVIQERPTNLGAGIEGLIETAQQRYEISQNSEDDKEGKERQLPEIEFSFHELLLDKSYKPPVTKEQNEAVQDDTQTQTDASEVAVTPQSDSSDQTAYVLQIGSFEDYKSADRIKASLALNGLEAYIQKITVEGQGDFFRVRIGPYEQFDDMQEIGATLSQLGYQPLRFRLRNRS